MCHKYNKKNFPSHFVPDESCVAKLLKEINYAIKQAALERKVNGVNKNYATKYTYIYKLYIYKREGEGGKKCYKINFTQFSVEQYKSGDEKSND